MSATNSQDLLAWCAALVNGSISDENFAHLQAALASDAEARRTYVAYVHMHRALEMWASAEASPLRGALVPLDASAVVEGLSLSSQAEEISAAQPTESVMPPPSSPQPAPIGHLSWLQSAWPPRLISLCILAMLVAYFGSLLTSLIREQRRLVAAASSNASAQATDAQAPNTQAGAMQQFTQSPDIHWRGQPPAPELRTSQLLELESGSAQFDLTSGTRVVVAAPARFRIESAARVWLERGQLVAHVGRQGTGFTVATPAVEVIDLGTEFDVEVEESAATSVVVRQGQVDIKPAISEAASPQKIQRLKAGEGLNISARGEITPLGPTDTQRHVRRFANLGDQLPSAEKNAPKLLAWYRLGEDDPAPAPGQPSTAQTLPNAAAASTVPLKITGAAVYTDQVAAPGSRRALTFGNDAVSGGCELAWDIAPVEDFALMAWVRVESVADSLLVVHWGGDGNGISLAILNDRWCGVFQGVAFLHSGVKYVPGKWTQVAVVCQGGQAHLYLDGEIASPLCFKRPNPPAKALLVGHGRGFRGQIDEVRLIDIRGGFRPEMLVE